MYGIGNNYFNYSMFGNQSYGLFGNSGGISSLFGGKNNNAWNSWNSMVPNYAQINYSLLGKYLTNNHSSINEKLSALSQHEKTSKSFYAEFNSTFNSLKTAASALKSFSANSVFRPTGYGSSDSKVATVTTDTAAGKDPISLNVTQTAAAQSYKSSAVSSSGSTLSGRNTLTITGSDGKKTAMNFKFDSSGTNQSYLSQIASTVNEKKLGVTATVTQQDGKSTLTFTADKTGTQNGFSVELTGDNVSKIGLQQDQEARDAKYSVDGGQEQTSQSNDIRIADGTVGVTLKGEGVTQLSKRTVDDAQSVAAVKKFAESYNKALSFLTKNQGTSTALDSLAYSFSTTRFQSGQLSRIGIAVDGSGALSVNESKLSSALKNNPQDVEKALGGASGVATNAYGKAVNAMNNSRILYPQSPSISYSNYMYGRDRSYVNSYMNGMFLSSLI